MEFVTNAYCVCLAGTVPSEESILRELSAAEGHLIEGHAQLPSKVALSSVTDCDQVASEGPA